MSGARRIAMRRALLVAWAGSALGVRTRAIATEPGVVVNGTALAAPQVAALRARYGTLRPGRYWHDPRTGWWGLEGGPTVGVASIGETVGGTLQADASGGTTGVFINGRNLHQWEVLYLRTLGPVWPGRYWADAFGNVGMEGQGLPFANLYMLAQQRFGNLGPHRAGQGGFNSDGRCMYYHSRDASGNRIGASSSGCG